MQKPWNHWIYSGLILFLFFQSVGDCAEWYREYEIGLDLMKKGDYEEAIPRLRAAISRKPEEGINIKFYGMKFGDYVPHYLLGRAYFFLKNYEAALSAFQISEEQGAIFRKPELSKNLRELKTVAAAQQAAAQLPDQRQKLPPMTAPVPAPVSEPVDRPADNTQTADTAKDRTETPDALELRQQSQQSLPVPTVSKTAPPVKEIPTIQRQENPADPIRMKVQSGAIKYFEGDYDGAIQILSGILRTKPNSVSAHFLIGCSYASKFLLTGSQEMKEKVTSAFQRAKQINPHYSAKDNPYISPAVLRMFEQSGGA